MQNTPAPTPPSVIVATNGVEDEDSRDVSRASSIDRESEGEMTPNKRARRNGSQAANKRLKATISRLNEEDDDVAIKTEVAEAKVLKADLESESSNDATLSSTVFDLNTIGTRPVRAVVANQAAISEAQNGLDESRCALSPAGLCFICAM
jgi:hypothetical protein